MAVTTAGPNLYELQWEDTTVTYAPGGLDGAPQLHYSGPMGRHAFEGDEIQVWHSARGLEISVTFERVSHLRTITLTLFIPELEFEDAEAEIAFRTVGIHASRRRGITSEFGAAMTSEPLDLQGLARNVALQDQPVLN